MKQATEERMRREKKKSSAKGEEKSTKRKSLKISTVYDSINNNCYSVHITALFPIFHGTTSFPFFISSFPPIHMNMHGYRHLNSMRVE